MTGDVLCKESGESVPKTDFKIENTNFVSALILTFYEKFKPVH